MAPLPLPLRPPAATTTDRILRNRPRARWLHAGVYFLTAFLLISGISVLGEGHPALEAILGGHLAAAHWHRWVGFALIGSALLLVALRPVAVRRFLAESVRFRRSDVRWFLVYPRFVLRPARHAPAPHDGHFDPGQRAMNFLIVASFAVLSATGIVLAVPGWVTPAAFGWSLRVHRASMWVLVGAVVGHVLVASGLLPAYRGVWRAMHGGGRVRRDLAERLWPRWADRAAEQGREDERAREEE